MKYSWLIFIVITYYSHTVFAQYAVKSKYISAPENNIDYVRKNVEFWIKYAYDPVHGGFFSSINRDGSLKSTTRKSLIVQTRHGYGFTRAFQLTGDEKYLEYANSALNFLYRSAWDTANEGWYCFANQDGSLDMTPGWSATANNKKWGFQQHYALVGIIANYEATRNATAENWMTKGINTLNEKMWDKRASFAGYYEDAAKNWSTKTGKGFTTTVDAITTNAELSYLTTGKAEYKERLLQLGDIIVNRFIPPMNDSRIKVLYPTSFSTDWVVNWTSGGSIGHFLKTAWVLGRAYLCDTTRTEYKNAAKRILDQSWTYKNGDNTVWDHVNGGPFNEINVSTGVLKSGTGNSKDYWTMEQGFTAPMINYYITKDPIYLEMADQSIHFFMQHLVDTVYGEIFSQTDPTGLLVRNDTKGDDYKASYHSIELGYYAYLYSKLYYLYQPASLYYKFEAKNEEQNIQLTPIPFEDNLLRIKEVTLNGAEFSSFDPLTRTLNIAANQGGKFKVTFQSLQKSITSTNTPETTDYAIYPIPARESITIGNTATVSSLQLVDLTGKVLYYLRNNGQNTLNIDLNELHSGIYFVVLQNEQGTKVTKKITKL